MTRLLVAALLSLVASQVFAMDSISGMTWKNRVVIVFGDSDDRRVTHQIDILTANRPELDDRDLVIIRVTDDEAKADFGMVIGLNADVMRTESDVRKGSFQLVLVGKDGGIKLRSDTVVSDVELFDVIDRMPMRRAERG